MPEALCLAGELKLVGHYAAYSRRGISQRPDGITGFQLNSWLIRYCSRDSI